MHHYFKKAKAQFMKTSVVENKGYGPMESFARLRLQ